MFKDSTTWSKIVFFVAILTSATSALSQDQGNTFSLQQAIRTGLERNSKIRANDKMLEAMQLRVEAAKRSQLPSVSLGYSMGISNTSSSTSGVSSDSRYLQRGGNASLNWNLFDGGAKKFRIESLDCQFRERQANYNSTNAMIPNTQGQIASSIVRNYISLSTSRSNLAFTAKVIEALQVIAKAAKTEAEISEVNNYLASLNQSIEEQKAGIESASSDFKFLVTLPAPESIFNLEQMIESILIPPTVETAFAIATQKSPAIKSARYQVECARLRYKSSRASAYSPRIDLSVGAQYGQRGHEITTGTMTQSSGASAMITMRINLDPSSSSELAAQSKEIEASQDNLDGATGDIQHSLSQHYPDLTNSVRFLDFFKSSLATGETNIKKYIDAINSGRNVNSSDAIKELGTYIGNWYQLQRTQTTVLNLKFQVQKDIGTLFESLGLNDDGVSRFQQLN